MTVDHDPDRPGPDRLGPDHPDLDHPDLDHPDPDHAARLRVGHDERRSATRRGMTLGAAAREFVRHPSPWMIGGLLAAAVVSRLWLADWGWADLIVPAAMVAAFPFAEWLIHVFILHWRPKHLGGLTLDTLLARKHREHHRDPRDIPLIFIPWQTLIWVLVVVVVIAVFAFGRVESGLTFLVVLGALGLGYEWTHFLIHTDYRPRTRLYRAVWRNHRFHHYRNEHYWFTVTTSGTADRVLHTHPDPADVPTSATAKNLHAITPVRANRSR